MIASLYGRLLSKSLQHVIIDVGGVGFSVSVPFSTYQALPETGNDVLLLIHTHVSDGAITLYGFYSEGEKKAFERLISISKIGPKSALAVLSGLPIGELKAAIIQKDIDKLSSIQGVGRKMAERIVLELSDRKDFLSDLKDFVPELEGSLELILKDAQAALEKLGYNERLIKTTLRKVLDAGKTDHTAESIIKEALRLL